MGDYSRFNIVYRLQKWMDSVPGQTFLNYAYSWGASIVIFGTLCKLTHLPGANLWLFLGMGTEVVVFFLSAFDRPFDKTAEGRELPTHVTEEYLETGRVQYSAAEEAAAARAAGASDGVVEAIREGRQSFRQGQPAARQHPAAASQGTGEAQAIIFAQAGTAAPAAELASAQQPNYVPQMSREDAEALNQAQGSYVDELKELVETLKKVNEQSTRLTRDSEEMENLNRTLTGISKVYEMQLKGASQQIGTIDQINEQTRKMAGQIAELNKIYARMIEAMTVNMKTAAPGIQTQTE